MGVSTDAYLWWGYNDATGQESGLPEYVVEHLRKHPIDHPKFKRFEPDELEDVLYFVLKGYGVELVGHCSSEYRMYGLAVSAPRITAWRGHPKQISLAAAEASLTEPTDEWKALLKRGADLLGWPTDKEPGWWLASYWG